MLAVNDKTSILDKISFGGDSAEDDSQLSEYFYRYSTYQNFIEKDKTILVGNRGAGKSAIFKHIKLKEEEKGNIVLALSPEEYSYEILSKIMTSEGEGNWAKQSSYSIAWQYLIYNLIFEALVKSFKGKLVRGPARRIYDYVRDNFQHRDINPVGTLISYLKRLESFKIGNLEGSLKVRNLNFLYDLEEIKGLMPDLVASLRHKKFFILVDELDKGWDNSEDAGYFIAGLFQAIDKVNRVSPNLKALISIRQELYDNIPQISDDAQKIRSKIEVIRWTKEELLELIGLRLSHCQPKLEGLSAYQKWYKIFAAEQASQDHLSSIDYILDRTLLRPREVIQFCRLCIEASLGEPKISHAAIQRAEFIHSEQKIRDLASEYRFQNPGLLDLFEAFRGKNSIIGKEELEEIILSLIVGDIHVGEAAWILNEDDKVIKKVLWQIGFLKACLPTKNGKCECQGYYERSTINIENVAYFQIHPAFHQYLALLPDKPHC
jgi:hypothetical protein